MFTFLVTVHVLAAVFVIGPVVIAPMTGLRAIRRQDAPGTRNAARQTTIFGGLSLLVLLFGVLAVLPSDRITFGDAWVSISLTLTILALLLILLIVVPSLHQAGRLLVEGDTVPDAPMEMTGESVGERAGENAGEPTSMSTRTATSARDRVNALYGRSAMASGLASLLLVVVTILMVTKPFS